MNKLTIFLAISLLLLAGCNIQSNSTKDSSQEITQPETGQSPESNDIFFSIPYLGTGQADVPYSISLCQPELNKISDLCGGVTETTNPAGGQPPYHFQLETGKGFLPMGLNLNLNGMITGTPATSGDSNFSICAVDMAGKQACSESTLHIYPPPETWEGTLTGTGFFDEVKYRWDANLKFMISYSIPGYFDDPKNHDYAYPNSSGTFSSKSTITQQSSSPDYAMTGSSVNEPITVTPSKFSNDQYLNVDSPTGKDLLAIEYNTQSGPSNYMMGYYSLRLTVTEYTDTTMSGSWGTNYGSRGHDNPNLGTFTLNKVS